MRLLVTAGLVLFATVAPAFADPKPSRPASSTEASSDCSRARAAGRTCELTIESEEVTGSAPKGGETTLSLAQFTHAASLIQLRKDFISEIIKTAEDL